MNRNSNPSTRLPIGTSELSRFTFHASHITHHASRLTRAFTLIELLVVIAVIAILASLVIPVSGAVRAAGTKRRAMAEMTEVETLIESYKEKLGHYPPDNPGNPLLNQLYYELMGTTNDTRNYITLDGNASVPVIGVSALFGPKVSGFVNSTKGGGGDEGGGATPFNKGLKSSQIAMFRPSKNANGPIILVGVPWQKGPPPFDLPPLAPLGTTTNLNPWRYNMSTPTNNPNTYDLWLDVVIGGKPFRICNWNKQPLKL